MREELDEIRKDSYVGGITPAHAGRIFSFLFTPLTFWDHPRACGKNYLKDGHGATSVGSPPRMREEFTCARPV